jgi:hypothetical protein
MRPGQKHSENAAANGGLPAIRSNGSGFVARYSSKVPMNTSSAAASRFARSLSRGSTATM